MSSVPGPEKELPGDVMQNPFYSDSSSNASEELNDDSLGFDIDFCEDGGKASMEEFDNCHERMEPVIISDSNSRSKVQDEKVLPQSTLAKFGFTKHIISKSGENCSVQIPPISPRQKRIPCKYCNLTFINSQGLGVHTKCAHFEVINKLDQKMNESPRVVLGCGGGSASSTKDNVADVIIEQSIDDVEDPNSKNDKDEQLQSSSKQRGASKRQNYSLSFKAESIAECEAGMLMSEVADKYRVSISMISKWLKDKEKIVNKAKSESKKLFKFRPKIIKNRVLFEKLHEKFTAARSRGQCVGFNWLFVTAKKIKKDLDGGHIGKHVVRSFTTKYNIKMRRKQRNKKHAKDFFPVSVLTWIRVHLHLRLKGKRHTSQAMPKMKDTITK